MIPINLEGHSEKIAPHNPHNLDPAPLYHQWRTEEALKQADNYLVVNSYDTGTGKTKASLSYLFELDSNSQTENVLFIAPTNALLAQHEEDISKFVAGNNLNFFVKRITAAETRKLSQQLIDEGNYQNMRPGEILYRLIGNYREFEKGEKRRKGLILVVNPDIFYYAMMFQYGGHDQRNLFSQFLNSFKYTVIDEFHYYDQKQLVFFLFYFGICKELQYFQNSGRKVCLLSATPNVAVQNYFDALLGKEHWALVAPHNEPADSDSLATIQTLAPLAVTFTSGDLTQHTEKIYQWLAAGQDGAVISDSLQRINELNSALKQKLGPNVRRITGPEPESKRQSATAAPLILATPTVDIGYNFEKADKKRQNIDFLICEAKYGDDLRQRLGRAGRVLAKSQKDIPGMAIAVVSDEAISELKEHTGKTFTRPEFAQLISNCQYLPQKHNLTRYIASYGITEVFYPIHHVHRVSLAQIQEPLEQLYKLLCQVFEVTYPSFKNLQTYYRNFYRQETWLQKRNSGTATADKDTAHLVSQWFKFMGADGTEYPPSVFIDNLDHPKVVGSPKRQEALDYFVASQYQLTKSLFTFRDSFQPATAVCYDPDNLFSSEQINSYSILHLEANYNVQWYTGREQFVDLHGSTPHQGDLYGQIKGYRSPKLSFFLTFDAAENLTQADHESFDDQWACRPVALKGIELLAKERLGGLANINHGIKTAIQDQFIPVLLLPFTPANPNDDFNYVGRAYNLLSRSNIFNYELHVSFNDRSEAKYCAYLGKDAWIAHAELKGSLKYAENLKSSAIFC